MEKDIEKLEEEVLLLKKRISILEGKENRRKAFGYIKWIVKILSILLILFGIWKAYDYVSNDVPKFIEDKISSINPFKKSSQ